MYLDFKKNENGLIPAIIQDNCTNQVLMLGYMNQQALDKTIEEKRVTFFSRSKNRLWTKGESSGNFLEVKNIAVDCDQDTVLIRVDPQGPVCHKGTPACFDEVLEKGFLYKLEEIVSDRIDADDQSSYTNRLYRSGINKVAQKVGEEAVELVIEAKDDNDELFKNEAADLMYHYLILLKSKGFQLADIEGVLKERNKKVTV